MRAESGFFAAILIVFAMAIAGAAAAQGDAPVFIASQAASAAR